MPHAFNTSTRDGETEDNSVSTWDTYGDPVSKGKKKLMMGEGNNQLRFNNVSGKFLQ